MQKRNQTTHIVIHTAAWPGDPSAADIRRVHVDENGWSDIGYHFVIRTDGHIEHGRDEELVGAHCRDANMNERSIGICCSGHGDETDFTDAQKLALATLVGAFMMEYSIPIGNVIGHREAGAAKTCPGEKVDMDALRAFIVEDSDGLPANVRRQTADEDEDIDEVTVSDDSNENNFSDEYEELVDTAEPVDHSDYSREKKRLFDWLVPTLAGETLAGKIGAVGKNIFRDYLPAGPLIDRLTDRVGDSLKENNNSTADAMSVSTNEDVMLKSKDPKTTVFGIVCIVAGIAAFFGIDSPGWGLATIVQTATPILTGAGLLAARDNKREEEA